MIHLTQAEHEALLAAKAQRDQLLQMPGNGDLTETRKAELATALGRALGTWEQPPAWLVQWHDDLIGVPPVRQRPEVH